MSGPRMRADRWLPLWLLAAIACDGDERDGSARAEADAAAAGRDDAAMVDAASAVGRFEITLVPAVAASADRDARPGYTSLLGRVSEAEPPQGITWTVTDAEGDCELLEPSIPACDPRCTSGMVCVAADRCAAHPRALDAGTVTLRGVRTQNGGEEISIEAMPPSYSYQQPGLAYPPFSEGDAVELEATGGELPAFTIDTVAIAPLAGIAETAPFDADTVTELSWTPPASSADSRIIVRVDISHHGGQKGEIVCDTADTGSFAIPAQLAGALIDLGIAGFPSLQIVRESRGSTQVGEGRIDLVISSPMTVALEIPGLVSCEEPGMQDVCPDGQVCGQDLRCQ